MIVQSFTITGSIVYITIWCRRDYFNLNVLLYAHDVVILLNNEADLQRSVYRLHKLGRQYYNVKAATNKTKVTAHYEQFSVRSNVIIEDKLLEHTSNFNYLDCNISFDAQNKVSRFQP